MLDGKRFLPLSGPRAPLNGQPPVGELAARAGTRYPRGKPLEQSVIEFHSRHGRATNAIPARDGCVKGWSGKLHDRYPLPIFPRGIMHLMPIPLSVTLRLVKGQPQAIHSRPATGTLTATAVMWLTASPSEWTMAGRPPARPNQSSSPPCSRVSLPPGFFTSMANAVPR